MAYSTDILKHHVTILNRKVATSSKWGKDGDGVQWEESGTVWASVDFTKGKRAMNAGALDVYSVVIVRMRWNNFTNLRSRMLYHGQIYNILGETFHEDYQDNIIQFQAQVIVQDKPMSSGDIGDENISVGDI